MTRTILSDLSAYVISGRVVLEAQHLRTTYKSVTPGDDWRGQLAVIYRF